MPVLHDQHVLPMFSPIQVTDKVNEAKTNKGTVAGGVRSVGRYVPTERVRTVSTYRPSGYIREEQRDTLHSTGHHRTAQPSTSQHSTAQQSTAQRTTQRRARQTGEHKGHTRGVWDRSRRTQPDQQRGKNRYRAPLVTDRMLQLIRKLVSGIRM